MLTTGANSDDDRSVKKIDKDQFLSISSVLSSIDKNFNLSIVTDFLKIHHFLRKL